LHVYFPLFDRFGLSAVVILHYNKQHGRHPERFIGHNKQKNPSLLHGKARAADFLIRKCPAADNVNCIKGDM
jgi:hypothetical protein